MNYRSVERTILAAREQLSLFKLVKSQKHQNGQQSEIHDWDFADANTKIETHGFHAYPAMMIPQIARSLIHRFGDENQILLDPFCGSGTAIVEARLAGLNSYGIDINPLALLLARVKSTPLSFYELKTESTKLCDRYLRAMNDLKDVKDRDIIPTFFNIGYWFHPKVSRHLAILKSVIQKIKDVRLKEFFLVAFSQTVREASYTRRGEFKLFRIQEEELRYHHPNVAEMFFTFVQRNMRGMAEFSRNARKDVFVKILDEDTRLKTSIPPKSVHLVITSPPYGDSRTTVAYGQFSRLSLQWLGVSWERVRQIDNHSLGGRKLSTNSVFQMSPSLQRTFRLIQKEDEKRAGDVVSFFSDFELCMREINRVCKKDSTCCFVVGNRTVKGAQIPTDSILAEIGENLGFRCRETLQRNIPNKRMPLRNSPTNIKGKLGDTMTKEHIVILNKSREVDHA